MDSGLMMGGMLLFCLAAMAAIIFSKQLKFLLRAGIRGLLGIAGIFIVNYITAYMGVTVGINLLTFFITAVLGLPGFACLYAVQFLLY